MSLFYSTLNGDNEDNFILDYPSLGTSSTISGNGGNDIVYGDISYFFSNHGLSIGTAQNINQSNVWSTLHNPDISNSTTIPHTTVYGMGAGTHWYSVTVNAGDTITLDIDYGQTGSFPVPGSFDSELFLYNPAQTLVASDDDSLSTYGGTGSAFNTDSYLEYTATVTGTYYIAVQQFNDSDLDALDEYLLQVSVDNHAATAVNVEGDDTIFGGSDRDVLLGLGGDDIVFGGSEDDILRGGNGSDRLNGNNHHDSLYGGNGRDFLFGGNGEDALDGGAYHDEIVGGNGNDTGYGGLGRDLLSGEKNNDTLYGGDHNDQLGGGDGRDLLFGGSGNDRMFGGNYHDTLHGNNYHDRMYGGNGDDLLFGGNGMDRLTGLSGTDRLTGGNGADIFHFNDGDDQDTITDFQNNFDTIELDNFDFTSVSQALSFATEIGNDVVFNFGGGDTLTVLNTNKGSLFSDIDIM